MTHTPRNFLLLELISRHGLSRRSKFSTFTNPTTGLSQQSCISYLKSCKSMTHLKQIHAQIFRVGLHQDIVSLNKLMAFCTDPFNGNLNYAEKMFKYIRYPCLLIYNLIIKAFAKKGNYKRTLVLFSKLREDGLWPDNFTYPFVFKAIGYLGEVSKAEKLRGLVTKTGLEFDTYVRNSLIDMYAQLALTDVMKMLFDEMPDRDVISWNVMISGYVKCRRFEDAINVFCRMQEESGLMPDEATVVSTLSACTALKRLELGKKIHHYVRDNVKFTPIIGNALLDMYCKCGCLSIARAVFEEMPSKNVICWTTMVSGYANCGELEEARELFEGSPIRDVVIWTAMINGYVQFNRFDEAVALFREMQIRKVKPDKFIVVSLLTGCAQTGAIEQGKWIHEFIDENRIPIDAVVGTALIEMYAKCGFIEKALEIFYGLRVKDTASWTSIICGLAMNGKTSKALELFSKMKQAGVRPDDITFIGVLSACSHGGLVEEGRKFFNSMRMEYQIKPKVEHYGCLVDLLGRAGLLNEAEELIKKIPDENKAITVPLYGSLLSACRIYGNVEMGERVAKQLVKFESSDSSVHTLLANIYAFADRWEDVTKVRRKMKDLGVKKTPGCSSIEVDSIIHEFFSGHPSHPEMREIYYMLNIMAKPLLGSAKNEMEGEDLVGMTFDEQGCSSGFRYTEEIL
ncbi:pentatricopeptide repeat-containing protein At1g31430 [Ricinus communis]|uniref:Pentatricopeptide repeat-containing protein, putative n=1 Tax=Ricinus communis TaxID=3988 RepID=B9STP1_RICCO|nr:pentatricopeptide repeat-containing protein At1g31430 [Ricinus communis]EEF33027.1 pentatricopeptide repeat-containing protein, putative [Ricinus communis]|eukprot:XP_002529360.1 pentatricopeptide repeat-containing protein At1g31430 [Ricinus communis]